MRRIRLAGFDYSTPGAYFITVCTRDKECLFGDVVGGRVLLGSLGRLAETCWRAVPEHCEPAELDVFIVMPNHVHAIIALQDRAGHARPLHLSTVVGSFKSAVSRQAGKPIWQRSYYERVIRNDAELESLRRYVVENPLRWALRAQTHGVGVGV